MKDWKRILISPDTPLLETIRIIGEEALQIALVVDAEHKLLGTVTDGDIRQALLRGLSMQAPARELMRRNPASALQDASDDEIQEIMRRRDILHLPLVDGSGRVRGLRLLKDIIYPARKDNLVILMAGGLGSRLGELTKDCPKPLLKIGNKPILENILTGFIRHGFHSFLISVNYLSEMIEEYFGDGSRWGVSIGYIREKKRLGTAGALSLLPERPSGPFFVMNGDILTHIDFGRLLDFHLAQGAEATMCTRECEIQIPYGVVGVQGQKLTSLEEKPFRKYHANAGVYLLGPSAMDVIPEDSYFDITELFERLLKEGRPCAAYPLNGFWFDIGRIDDYRRAASEYVGATVLSGQE